MANQNVTKDVMQMEVPDQKKWLEQRGWIPSQRDTIMLWRHPETGVRYVFAQAFKLAMQDCRLPADYQLTPECGKPTPSETVTDAVSVNEPKV